MFSKIALIFILLQTVNAVDNRLVCEGEILQADCPKGSTIIILSALYGKQDSRICQVPGNHVNDCAAGNTLNIISFKCHRKQRCSIPATNQIFGDPCYGTRKYLEVSYECITGSIETKVACEGGDVTVTCPDGYVVWTANALYGRKNPLLCLNSDNNIKTNKCESASALDVVQSKCDGLQQCTVQANNGLFGDPCYGTTKYLEVDFQCLPHYAV